MSLGIFSLIWPKINFSAASVRTFGIMFTQMSKPGQIDLFCAAKQNKNDIEELKKYPYIQQHPIILNDENSILRSFYSLKTPPDLVVFDTFIAEEMYSHFIKKRYPNCLKILDLQDLHSLRKLRQSTWENIKQEASTKTTNDLRKPKLDENLYFQNEQQILNILPSSENSQIFNRELASIYRSDMVITCSDYEYEILKNKYKIDHVELITYFSILQDKEKEEEEYLNLDNRTNFVWIGNHSHPPNLDSLNWLVKDIWPKINKKLPEAELHIYGSNFQKEFSGLESLQNNIKSCGLMDSIDRLRRYRVMLAPLRFGAGIKGKICDAWNNYLPVVTTRIGAEGLFYNSACEHNYGFIDNKQQFLKDRLQQPTALDLDKQNLLQEYYMSYNNNSHSHSNSNSISKELDTIGQFGGYFSSNSVEEYVDQSINLYTDDGIWKMNALIGFQINKRRLSFIRNNLLFQKKQIDYQMEVANKGRKNLMYQVTWSETQRSTENMQKYLQEKNKNQQSQQNKKGRQIRKNINEQQDFQKGKK